MGYDPTGTWDWGLFGKIILTVAVVAVCMTGVGALAAATATAIGVSTSAAVTTALVTAGISTTFSAIDGAICAEQSGGKWYDGAMAGAIGGSVGSFVSAFTTPIMGPDSSLRMNVLGRTTSSLIYDVTYDFFDSESEMNTGKYAADVTMDAVLSTISYHYTGGLSSGFLSSALNGFFDGVTDVFQTEVFP